MLSFAFFLDDCFSHVMRENPAPRELRLAERRFTAANEQKPEKAEPRSDGNLGGERNSSQRVSLAFSISNYLQIESNSIRLESYKRLRSISRTLWELSALSSPLPMTKKLFQIEHAGHACHDKFVFRLLVESAGVVFTARHPPSRVIFPPTSGSFFMWAFNYSWVWKKGRNDVWKVSENYLFYVAIILLRLFHALNYRDNWDPRRKKSLRKSIYDDRKCSPEDHGTSSRASNWFHFAGAIANSCYAIYEAILFTSRQRVSDFKVRKRSLGRPLRLCDSLTRCV